jgi:trehalose 6-phosphate phosphatase
VTPPSHLRASLLDALEPLRARPERSALLFDFDGTLAPVVDEPSSAAAEPAVLDLLDELASRYARVAVVSGRPVAFLADRLPPSLWLSGLYGLEQRTDLGLVLHPAAVEWQGPVSAAATDLGAQARPGGPLAGAVVEPKGASLTLHWRTAPTLEAAAQRAAVEVAARHGLTVRSAKASAELHPPVAVDKGTAAAELLGGCRSALFAGDDVGDLPAVRALRAAEADGRLDRSVVVAVGGPEAPPELLAEAHEVLDHQRQVAELLVALLPDGP